MKGTKEKTMSSNIRKIEKGAKALKATLKEGERVKEGIEIIGVVDILVIE